MGLLSKFSTLSLPARWLTRSASVPDKNRSPRLLFVSHEASRTGAPLILLNLLRHFQQHCDADCQAILHQGGALHGDFAHRCQTECLDLPRQPGPLLEKRMGRWLARGGLHCDNTVAICNSMESRFITEQLHAHHIPVISLIHELPTSYSEPDYQIVYRCSERIVFPVQCVRDATNHKVTLPPGKSLVLPQGLLNPKFGTQCDRRQARQQIRLELGLPQESVIVLGCGTLDLRKGIDHFAQVACRAVAHRQAFTRPVHFVWLGEGPRWTHSLYHYVKLDLEKRGFHRHVHFVGERDDVEPYFVGSDVFLMCSRVDPFPCVIHEAMAAGLPIVSFDDNGGAPEAIAHGAGIVVSYADYDGAAESIHRLLDAPEVAGQMAGRARQRVQTQYRFADYGDRLIELVEGVARRQLRTTPQAIPMVRAA